jgi:hypothetical protein
VLWVVGQNPGVTLPNLNLTFDAMAKLETLVVQEIWETETAGVLESGQGWTRRPSTPKSSCCLRRSSWKRTARSATRAAWCNGGTRP